MSRLPTQFCGNAPTDPSQLVHGDIAWVQPWNLHGDDSLPVFFRWLYDRWQPSYA